MPIKSTEYVFITSGVVGASVAQQELIGRRFTEDPRVPMGQILRVNSGQADTFFGGTTPEAAFARQYFSVVLPAPISRPKALQFAAYAPSGRVPRVYGREITASLADLQAVTNGSITLQLGDAQAALSGIDLSAAVSFADVASAMQVAIRAQAGAQYANALVTYDALSRSFLLQGDTVALAEVSVSDGNLAQLLGWVGLSVIYSPGSAPQTPLQAFQAAEEISDSFGSASFGSAIALADALPVSAYVEGENVKYMMLWPVTETNYAAWSAAMIGFGSNGLVLNRAAGEYKESIPMAIQAASDFTVRNGGRVNYMFRDSSVTPDITDTAESRILNAARVNYYGNTAVFGQIISFFQRGYLMGGPTAPLDMGVHSGEQWLKSYMTSKFFALLIGVRGIATNNDGRGAILAVVNDGALQAKFNGVISVGKVLTVTQIETINQITGDPMAWREVQNNGYWADVTFVEETGGNGITEYVAKYTLIYSKADMIRKVEGSHNLV